MINIDFYNTLATNYAETLQEGCGCLVELTCVVQDEPLERCITSVSCRVCKKQYPETLKMVNDKIKVVMRGLWRE